MPAMEVSVAFAGGDCALEEIATTEDTGDTEVRLVLYESCPPVLCVLCGGEGAIVCVTSASAIAMRIISSDRGRRECRRRWSLACRRARRRRPSLPPRARQSP